MPKGVHRPLSERIAAQQAKVAKIEARLAREAAKLAKLEAKA